MEEKNERGLEMPVAQRDGRMAFFPIRLITMYNTVLASSMHDAQLAPCRFPSLELSSDWELVRP